MIPVSFRCLWYDSQLQVGSEYEREDQDHSTAIDAQTWEMGTNKDNGLFSERYIIMNGSEETVSYFSPYIAHTSLKVN